MTKLCERALVKDLLQLPRADLRQDPILNSLIETVSAEAERICRRKFAYREGIVETHPSYEQSFLDPEPQFFVVDSFPIDTTTAPAVQWSSYDQKEGLTVTLNPETGDYTYDAEKGLFSIRYMGAAVTNLPILGGIMFSYHPRGFQVTYNGGYPTTSAPSPDDDADPLDDYGVTQVPDGLKLAVAKKVAADYRGLRPNSDQLLKRGVLNPAELALNTFRQDLTPYVKRDRLF